MDQKIALITGANGGIGRLLVEKLTLQNIKCIKVDLDKDQGEENYTCDLTNQSDILKLIKDISLEHDHVDYLFNVAGVGIYKNIEDLTLEEWNYSINLNLNAPFILSKGLLPLLKKSPDGLIFNVGSGMGKIPWPGRVAYCSSKFGLRGLSLTLAQELAQENIKVVHMTLGSVMTNFGTGGIEKRKELQKNGKKYLEAELVAEKIIEIINSETINAEYELFPEGYTD